MLRESMGTSPEIDRLAQPKLPPSFDDDEEDPAFMKMSMRQLQNELVALGVHSEVGQQRQMRPTMFRSECSPGDH